MSTLPMSANKLLIVTQNLPPAICGVGDYATLLAQELQRQNPALVPAFLTRAVPESRLEEASWAEPFLSTAEIYRQAPTYWRLRDLPALWRVVQQSEAAQVHFHYVPHMYYRGGVGLAVSLLALWLRWQGRSVVVTFHELYTSWGHGPKSRLISLIQRVSFWLLLLAASKVVVTTQKRADTIRKSIWWKRPMVVPVGANFPNMELITPEADHALRQKWGLPVRGEDLIMANLGHAAWVAQPDWLLAALEGVERDYPHVWLLMIGGRPERLPAHHPLTRWANVIFTGSLGATEISQLLALSHIYLLALDDGISGRRTALMAGLQLGLPIIATSGHNTEPDFVKDLPVELAKTTEQAKFVELVRNLAHDHARREEMGQAAKQYFQSHFSWPQLAAQQRDLFETTQAKTVLFVNGAAERGGGEVVLQNTVTGLDRTQFRPVVIFLQSGSLVREFREAGITSYVLQAGHFRQLWPTLKTVFGIWRIISQEQVTLVQSAGSKIHLYGGVAAWLRRRPAIMVVQDNLAQPSKWDKLSRWVPVRLLIANSQATAQTVYAFHAKWPVKVVYPGVDPAQFQPATTRIDQAVSTAKPDEIAIGVFARLQRWKGLSVFVEAARLVHEELPQARFFIVGDSLFGLEAEYQAELKAQIAEAGLHDCVQLLGFRPDVAELMNTMDIVVSPSITPEGFGLTVVEAMLTAKPVVATAHGGPMEIVVDGVTGLLVPPGDAPALAAALLDLAEHPEKRQQMGEAGRARALTHFSREAMVKGFTSIYQDLAG